MSLLLLHDTHQLADLGNIAGAEAFGVPTLTLNVLDVGAIASAEAFGVPTVTQQSPVQTGAVIWPWFWAQRSRDIVRPPQLPDPEHEEEPQRMAVARGIPSAEAFGAPELRLRVIEIGGIASGEEFGEPTVKIRRLRVIRRAEEMALLVWRKAA